MKSFEGQFRCCSGLGADLWHAELVSNLSPLQAAVSLPTSPRLLLIVQLLLYYGASPSQYGSQMNAPDRARMLGNEEALEWMEGWTSGWSDAGEPRLSKAGCDGAHTHLRKQCCWRESFWRWNCTTLRKGSLRWDSGSMRKLEPWWSWSQGIRVGGTAGDQTTCGGSALRRQGRAGGYRRRRRGQHPCVDEGSELLYALRSTFVRIFTPQFGRTHFVASARHDFLLGASRSSGCRDSRTPTSTFLQSLSPTGSLLELHLPDDSHRHNLLHPRRPRLSFAHPPPRAQSPRAPERSPTGVRIRLVGPGRNVGSLR